MIAVPEEFLELRFMIVFRNSVEIALSIRTLILILESKYKRQVRLSWNSNFICFEGCNQTSPGCCSSHDNISSLPTTLHGSRCPICAA